jgi:hypothetical protein
MEHVDELVSLLNSVYPQEPRLSSVVPMVYTCMCSVKLYLMTDAEKEQLITSAITKYMLNHAALTKESAEPLAESAKELIGVSYNTLSRAGKKRKITIFC